MDLVDKDSGEQAVLSNDNAIDVVILKVFVSYHKYSEVKLVKSSFLCFLKLRFDVSYIIASVVNATKSAQDRPLQ